MRKDAFVSDRDSAGRGHAQHRRARRAYILDVWVKRIGFPIVVAWLVVFMVLQRATVRQILSLRFFVFVLGLVIFGAAVSYCVGLLFWQLGFRPPLEEEGHEPHG